MSGPTMLATGAEFSPCGTYRYSLTRVWDARLPRCAFVLFNPSTADAFEDDPTIRRCIGFADRWGFGSLEIVNLFAFRSTDPKGLELTTDPVGPMNDAAIRRALDRNSRRVIAWGALATRYAERAERIEVIAKGGGRACRVLTIGDRTKGGFPPHPLYLRADTQPLCALTGQPAPNRRRPASRSDEAIS